MRQHNKTVSSGYNYGLLLLANERARNLTVTIATGIESHYKLSPAHWVLQCYKSAKDEGPTTMRRRGSVENYFEPFLEVKDEKKTSVEKPVNWEMYLVAILHQESAHYQPDNCNQSVDFPPVHKPQESCNKRTAQQSLTNVAETSSESHQRRFINDFRSSKMGMRRGAVCKQIEKELKINEKSLKELQRKLVYCYSSYHYSLM